ncbi:hypothetical protein T484DRAFT_1639709 [Baffinella frigidus]|nr:hypothetical protein T484DRAFT_1639709 [Cryptophyta sp. CCMP2293]
MWVQVAVKRVIPAKSEPVTSVTVHPRTCCTKPNQIKSNQIKPNQPKSSQIKPNDQIKSNEIKRNQTKSNEMVGPERRRQLSGRSRVRVRR